MKTNGFSLTRAQIWNYLILFAFICTASILACLNTSGQYNASMAVLTLAVNLHSCFKVKHNWYLLIIYGFIFYSNYSICMANYIAHIDDYFTAWQYTQTAVNGLYILLVFSLLLNLIAPQHKPERPIPPLLVNNRYHLAITVGILFLLICIGIFSFSRPDIAGERGSGSALYEYAIVGFIIGLYYTGKVRWLQFLYVGLGIFFVLQNFMFGGRIESLQIILLFVFAFLTDKLKLSYVLPFLFIGLIILTGIGHFRAQFELNTANLLQVINILKNNYLVTDTAYAAYFASLTFLAVLPFTPWAMRLHFFYKFLVYIFLGSGVSGFNLWGYTNGFFRHYGGGLLPFFAYFYLGIIGVLVTAYYLWFLFKKINSISENSSGFWRCAGLYLTVSVFRWYLYSPSQITRGFLLFSICYLIAHYAYKCLNFKPILHTKVKA